MKKLVLGFLIAVCPMVALSQPKIKSVEPDFYDRSSLSVIVVNRGDKWDDEINNFLSNLEISEKFDINDIPIKKFRIDMSDRSNPVGQARADKMVAESGVMKQVLAYIFNRQPDGSMDASRIVDRGLYNAKDQDILNAAAAKIHDQRLEWGEKLVDNSYILVLDFWNLSRDHSDTAGDHYYAWIDAYTYKIDFDGQKLDEFYRNAWADPDSSPSKKAAARKWFDDLEVGFTPVASVMETNSGRESTMAAIASIMTLKGNTNGTMNGAMNEAYTNIMYSLERKIPQWNVAVPVIATNPIRAKVGDKEGIRNGQRYRAYSYAEDKDGNLVSQPRGYLRIIKIEDNVGVATGNSVTSEFCQISGLEDIQEGWTIKQSNDSKISIGLEPRVGGVSKFSVNVGMDYLFHIFENGNSIYGLFNIGVDPAAWHSEENFRTFNLIFSAGAAYSFRFTRMFDLAPYVVLGIDWVGARADGSSAARGAYFFEPGARFSVNFYPLAIYAKAFYGILADGVVGEGALESPHRSRPGLGLGVKWSF